MLSAANHIDRNMNININTVETCNNGPKSREKHVLSKSLDVHYKLLERNFLSRFLSPLVARLVHLLVADCLEH